MYLLFLFSFSLALLLKTENKFQMYSRYQQIRLVGQKCTSYTDYIAFICIADNALFINVNKLMLFL